MARRFRFSLWPAVATIVGLSILVSLGTWQYLRFREKLEAERLREQRVDAPPLVIDSLDDLGPEADYRIARARGRIDDTRRFVMKHRIRQKQPGLWLLSPLHLEGGGVLLVNRGWVPQKDRDRLLRNISAPRGETWEGLVLTPRRIVPDEDLRRRLDDDLPDTVDFETYDVDSAYELVGGETPDRPTVLVLGPEHSGDPYPMASYEHVTKPYLTSEKHLGYAITWYTMALALLALYLAAACGFVRSGHDQSREQRV